MSDDDRTAAPRIDDPAHAGVRAALRLDDRLDDLRRARLWGQLDRALDAAGPPAPAARWWARGAVRVGGGVALALAAGVLGWIVVGGGGGAAQRGGAQQVLEVPAGASARAQLGPAAAVTLYGPSRLEVDRTEGEVDVTLGRGMLAGDYDHARGGHMRVRTPHAVIEIVGTVFAIEVTTETCVAVADGQVRVTATGVGQGVRRVHAGQRYCVGAAAAGPVPRELEERMEAHAGRTIVATAVAPAPAAPRTDAVTPPPAVPVLAVAPVSVAPSAPPAPRPPRAMTTVAPPAVEDVVAPAPPPPPAAPAVDAAAELYATAEQAMKYDDTELADALLARLVVDHPDSDLIDEALFERARLAYGRGAWNAARASLDRLLAGGPTPLRAPAQFLLCRIAVRTGDRDAGRCLDELRRAAPDARFALEALELRVQVAFDHGGCTAAAPFVLELRTAAPSRAATATWARRCPLEAP